MPAYYNEIDAKAAAWLRELIARNLIAPGDVDERSIVDVRPDDLRGYTQCHFFAGIGVWSYALRLAGWPDERRVWTASLPCQPWSAAGKGEGVDDDRHLWPVFFRLVDVHRPDVCFGEQVASNAGLTWLDLVSADLEGAGYAVGSADLCAAGVGAPHIRQRLWWVADAHSAEREGRARRSDRSDVAISGIQSSGLGNASSRGRGELGHAPFARSGGHADSTGVADGVGDAQRARLEGHGRNGDDGDESRRIGTDAPRPVATPGAARGMADGAGQRPQGRGLSSIRESDGVASFGGRSANGRPVGGFWADADWIPCTDGKARPVEPGSFPLAHGAPARVGRLRGYGNAIVSEVAKEFIIAYLDVTEGELTP